MIEGEYIESASHVRRESAWLRTAGRELADLSRLGWEDCYNVLAFLRLMQPDPGFDWSGDERLANAYTIVHTWLGESLLREDGTGDATNKCSDDYLLLSARAIAHLLAVLEPVADTNIGSAENCGRIVMLERVARAIAAKEAPADG